MSWISVGVGQSKGSIVHPNQFESRSRLRERRRVKETPASVQHTSQVQSHAAEERRESMYASGV
jgi:hypothetical protein